MWAHFQDFSREAEEQGLYVKSFDFSNINNKLNI